jgi:hypothetical protein
MTSDEPKSIYFFDSRVVDSETLVALVQDEALVFILPSNQDGVVQIANAVTQYSDLDAIHIISHGSDGALNLGDTVLTSENLETYKAALEIIGNSLSASGEVLLYGCDVASTERGQSFVQSLAYITGADVATKPALMEIGISKFALVKLKKLSSPAPLIYPEVS